MAEGGVNCDTERKVRKNLNTLILQPKNFKTVVLFCSVEHVLCRTVVV